MITDQEANELCLLVQKGGRSAGNRLLKACEPYMQTLVNQNQRKSPLPTEELLQEARIAFWEASKTFSPQLGRFLPYAAKKASWGFQRAYKTSTETIHLPDTTLRAKVPSKATNQALLVKFSGRYTDYSFDGEFGRDYGWDNLADPSTHALDLMVREESLAKVWDALPEEPKRRTRIIRKFGLKDGIEVPYAQLSKDRQYAHKEIGYDLRAMKVTLRSHTFRQTTRRRPNAEL
jgi:hypothetical protein